MQGVIAAVPTPVDAGGAPQKDEFLEHCCWALNNGCDGLNILGSTGEANSTSNENRKKIMSWAADNLDRSRLMVGTGTPSFHDTIELTKHADDLGYQVALILPPYFYKPLSDTGLKAWFEGIHSALGDRDIEIYFYNFPQMTGIAIPETVIAELASRYPVRFTGIKDSSGDLDYARAVLKAAPSLSVFPSSETSLSEAAESGFAGCISATVNITAPLCAAIWASRNEPPLPILETIGQLRADIAAAGLIPAVKYLVGHRTASMVWRNCFPPFVAIEIKKAEALAAKISQI